MIERLKKRLMEVRKEREKELEAVASKSDDEKLRVKDVLILELPNYFCNDHIREMKDLKHKLKEMKITVSDSIKKSEYCQQSFEELLSACRKKRIDGDLKEKLDLLQQRVSGMGRRVTGVMQHYNILIEDFTAIQRLPYAQKHRSANLPEMARFFDYLETRALKSSTMRAFEDIFLCRAIQYIPLPTKKLFAMKYPDGDLIKYKDSMYRMLPRSFIRLREVAPKSEMLLYRKFDENQLSKKIKRLGRYAGLSKFNLSILRHSTLNIFESCLQDASFIVGRSTTDPVSTSQGLDSKMFGVDHHAS